MATHWNNRANYNPASISRDDYIYLFSNIRTQWQNINGAPKVYNIQASQFFYNLHSAFGLSLVGDKIGLSRTLNPMVSYAYRISNENDWSLSFGVAGGVFSRFTDGTLFDPVVAVDPLLFKYVDKINVPDVNLGAEFENQHFIFGLSTTHLLSLNKASNLFTNSNHRYAYAIYKNTNSIMFDYNVGLQVVNRSRLTVFELNSTIKFKHETGLRTGSREMIDLGLTYRSTKQISFLFGVNLSPNLRVGYVYDFSYFPGYGQNGTNEIVIEYRIPSRLSSGISCRCNSWYN